jgi:predicted ribosome-associated RNA-binding protein Tma20
VAIEVNQQDHGPARVTIHPNDQLFFEPNENLNPTTRLLEHLDPPIQEVLIQAKAVR